MQNVFAEQLKVLQLNVDNRIQGSLTHYTFNTDEDTYLIYIKS